MTITILAVDVGTTAMKLGIFRAAGDDPTRLEQAAIWSQDYQINTYNNGLCADIEPAKWRDALASGCRQLAPWMPEVDAVALSGTTPGLTAMDREGEALLPAILMLDQRSRRQAEQIIARIGLQRLLAETANMPVAGGCSLASILWIRENVPELYRKAACFGHSNTYVARWLTGELAIDPSSASLTALYNTTANDLTWNAAIASELGIDLDRLPRLIPSRASAGRVREPIARDLQLSRRPPVIIGGNDAVLAAYSAGCREPGQVINVNGTCEITLVCLGRCYPSRNYNIRAHVLPRRWLTLYVMNAGGIALEWFRSVFCSELGEQEYFGDFLPRAIDQGLARESSVRYVPFLMGSRYKQEPLRAEFVGLNQLTTREELAAALVRGLAEYQREHLEEISPEVPLAPIIAVTGGAVSPALIRAKRRWMRDCEYMHIEQSSLRGAAMLALEQLTA
jgi:sugar (pentulose or hexulose) kinase